MKVVDVYFVSDHTGVTAEVLGRSLLARFADLGVRSATRPFVDDAARAEALVHELDALTGPVLVFSTIADPTVLARVSDADAIHLDLFAPFLPRLEEALGRPAEPLVGAAHGVRDLSRYQARIDAVEYALATDDGSRPRRYGHAQVVIIGVSRAGKSPTCLYLAMQYGVYAANVPLADEDLEAAALPAALHAHRDRLFGLTIDPVRLHELREQRRSRSAYASLERCEHEVRLAERLFQAYAVPHQETTTLSVEELAAVVIQRTGLQRHW